MIAFHISLSIFLSCSTFLLMLSSEVTMANPKLNDPFVSGILAQSDEECGDPEGDGLMFSCEVRDDPIVIVQHGQSLRLNCSASGSRNPIVLWRKNGKTLSHGGSRRTGARPFLRTEMLYHDINCVSPQDAGVYTCVAFADGVVIRRRTTIYVVADLDDRKCSEPAEVQAPKIYASTETIFDAPGAAARLTCRASGSPAPEIAWYQRQMDMSFKKIENNDGYSVQSNGDLVLPPLSLAPVHFGEYKCEASNEAGKDEAVTYIQVMPLSIEQELTKLAPVAQSSDMFLTEDLGDIDVNDLLALKKRHRRFVL